MDYNNQKGIWRTVAGRRVFIADGEELYDAMAASGKFKALRKTPIRLNAEEYSHVMHELDTYYDAFKGCRTVAKCIEDRWNGGGFIYVFENRGFNHYVILAKLCIETNIEKERFVDDVD